MISIILVNYNGAMDTIECIRSIRRSSGIEYRIIVVDNASTDDSVVKLNEENNNTFELLIAKENRGFSSGNNIGINRALELGTDYILLLNNDTLIESDTIQKLVDGLRNYKDCGITVGKILFENDRNKIWYAGGEFNCKTARAWHWHCTEQDDLTPETDTKVTFATGCCMCIPVEVINKVGLMDESFFLYHEDVDYCLRVSRAGYQIMYIPDARIYHKVSSSTGGNSKMAQYYKTRNNGILIEKHFQGVDRTRAYMYMVLRGLLNCVQGKQNLIVFINALDALSKKESGSTHKTF